MGSTTVRAREQAAAGTAVSSRSLDQERTTKPSVLWILLDACRADHLSCYGYERETTPRSRLWKAFSEFAFIPSPSGKVYAELHEVRQTICQCIEKHKDSPFFLYVHTFDTHRPHHHPHAFVQWFPGGGAPSATLNDAPGTVSVQTQQLDRVFPGDLVEDGLADLAGIA